MTCYSLFSHNISSLSYENMYRVKTPIMTCDTYEKESTKCHGLLDKIKDYYYYSNKTKLLKCLQKIKARVLCVFIYLKNK